MPSQSTVHGDALSRETGGILGTADGEAPGPRVAVGIEMGTNDEGADLSSSW